MELFVCFRELHPEDPDQLSSLQKNTIKNIFNCEFMEVNMQVFYTLILPWAADRSRSCGRFAVCLRHSRGMLGALNCIPFLNRTCSSANVNVVKTVRLSMKQAEALLQEDPEVKVIHLVRDPRGVLRSRQVTRVGLSYHETAEQLCAKVVQDIKVRSISFLGRFFF